MGMLSAKMALAWTVLGLATTCLAMASEAAESELPARELLAKARRARAVWLDFPGFRARLEVKLPGQQAVGHVTVTASGDVKLADFPADFDTAAVQSYLESLVGHRLADPESTDDVEYVAEDKTHPLGRLIKFVGDEKLHSSYRIRDDVVTEVNRQMGPTRFMIDVLEVERNAAGKYLPQVFTVSFWNSGSGALERTETHLNHWTPVGGFDLPRAVMLSRSSGEGSRVMQLSLSDHELLH
jgi:uncharacterized protein DUF3386